MPRVYVHRFARHGERRHRDLHRFGVEAGIQCAGTLCVRAVRSRFRLRASRNRTRFPGTRPPVSAQAQQQAGDGVRRFAALVFSDAVHADDRDSPRTPSVGVRRR